LKKRKTGTTMFPREKKREGERINVPKDVALPERTPVYGKKTKLKNAPLQRAQERGELSWKPFWVLIVEKTSSGNKKWGGGFCPRGEKGRQSHGVAEVKREGSQGLALIRGGLNFPKKRKSWYSWTRGGRSRV